MLTEETRAKLQVLEQRNKLVRDRVMAVADGRKTGIYLYGRPGIAKTTIVTETLRQHAVDHEYIPGHMTALGLFNALAEKPDAIFVLDDIGGCISEKKFFTLMLSALGKPDSTGARLVRYRTGSKDRHINFRGGICFISNLPVSGHSAQVLEAFRQRIRVLEYDPTDAEIEAQIRMILVRSRPASPSPNR